MRTLVMIAALTVPLAATTAAMAAGGGGGSTAPATPPKSTETTKNCFDVRQWDPEIKKWVRFSQPVNGVWDPAIRKCVRPDKTSQLDPDTQYDAVRELAYAGRLTEAQQVLAAMPNQDDDRVLTYWGFTHRKMGDLDLANVFYQRAIDRNPDNILARSYMGQGLVETGDRVAAIGQLREIRARGGSGSWAETSLSDAIATGRTYSY